MNDGILIEVVHGGHDAILLKDRQLHPMHSIAKRCFGSRTCSTHYMAASSRSLSGDVFGVRNASIFMTTKALCGAYPQRGRVWHRQMHS